MSDTASTAIAVTPSDSVNLNAGCIALYVGSGGDVSVLPSVGSTAVVFKNVADGTVLPVKAQRVNATSTTAQNIVALY